VANNFVPGSAIVRIIWSHVGLVVAYNVLGAVKPGGVVINQALADTLGAAIKSACTTSGLVTQLAPGTNLVRVGLRDYSTPNQAEFQDAGSFVVGTGTGDPLNPSQAHAITLRTALAGPRYRGRVYLSGFTEAANDTTALCTSALQTACLNFITATQSAIAAAGMTLAVLSHPSDRTVITRTVTLPGGEEDIDTIVQEARPGAVTPVVVVLSRNRVWDSQRRRTASGSQSTLLALTDAVYGHASQAAPAAQSRR